MLCPHCRNKLGERFGSLFLQRYHKRATLGPLPHAIRCEDCGGCWIPEGAPIPEDVAMIAGLLQRGAEAGATPPGEMSADAGGLTPG